MSIEEIKARHESHEEELCRLRETYRGKNRKPLKLLYNQAHQDRDELIRMVEELQADGGAAAWILEWVSRDAHEKPDIPEIVKVAHAQYTASDKKWKEAAIRVAELEAMLRDANGVLRSASEIAKREHCGEAKTNWSSFKGSVDKELLKQHAAGINQDVL